MKYLLKISDMTHPATDLSLLKSFSVYILSAKNKKALFYFLSDNLITKIIEKPCEGQSDEYIYYYITLLKSLSVRIDSESINLFYRPHHNYYPLLENAVKYYNYNDGLIRNSIKTIVITHLKSRNVTRPQRKTDRLFLFLTDGIVLSKRLLPDSRSTESN